MLTAPAGIKAQYEARDTNGEYLDGYDLLEAEVVCFLPTPQAIATAHLGEACILTTDGVVERAAGHKPTRPAKGDGDGEVTFGFVGLVGELAGTRVHKPPKSRAKS